MWLRDRSGPIEFMRIGRHSVERWAGSDANIALVGAHAMNASTELTSEDLLPAVRSLYGDPPSRAITVLLESAWMPVILVEVGEAVLNHEQIDALVRHRFGLVQEGKSTSTTLPWELRVDYRAGERFALGFGMPVRLPTSLARVGESAGLVWAALLPAFAWGFGRLQPARQWRRGGGWWLWPEQDRMLVTKWAAGQLVALTPAAVDADNAAQLRRRIEVECIRAGIGAASDPIVAATWQGPSTPSEQMHGVTWESISEIEASRPESRAAPVSSRALP